MAVSSSLGAPVVPGTSLSVPMVPGTHPACISASPSVLALFPVAKPLDFRRGKVAVFKSLIIFILYVCIWPECVSGVSSAGGSQIPGACRQL